MEHPQASFEALHQLLQRYLPLSGNSIARIESVVKPVELRVGDLIAEPQSRDMYEYLLISGVIQRYVISDDGVPVTTALYCDGTVLTPHMARTENGLSLYYLKALTNCCVYFIPVREFDALRYSFEDIRLFGMKVVEEELRRTLENETFQRSRSALDRLLHFRKTNPGLENRIPHTVIASFLGITPVSLSRLRKGSVQD